MSEGAFATVALLRWMHPSVGPYSQVFRASWKIVVVACMVGGIAAYAVLQIQERLQAKNKLLEQAVERGTLQLQQQEQELKRALEIQKDLLPKELPQLPGIGWRARGNRRGPWEGTILMCCAWTTIALDFVWATFREKG